LRLFSFSTLYWQLARFRFAQSSNPQSGSSAGSSAAKSAARVQGGGWLVFYLILLPIVELHVGIGFYRIAVKWGFVLRKGRKGFKRFENILTAIFIVIGLVTLARFWFLALPK
jgi:fumarate reductase subunit C